MDAPKVFASLLLFGVLVVAAYLFSTYGIKPTGMAGGCPPEVRTANMPYKIPNMRESLFYEQVKKLTSKDNPTKEEELAAVNAMCDSLCQQLKMTGSSNALFAACPPAPASCSLNPSPEYNCVKGVLDTDLGIQVNNSPGQMEPTVTINCVLTIAKTCNYLPKGGNVGSFNNQQVGGPGGENAVPVNEQPEGLDGEGAVQVNNSQEGTAQNEPVGR